jgi:hypothetical protein
LLIVESLGWSWISELFVEFAGGAGDEDSTRDTALTIFYPLYNARWLATLGAVGALGRVHYLFAISCFGNFCHRFSQIFGVKLILPYAANVGIWHLR